VVAVILVAAISRSLATTSLVSAFCDVVAVEEIDQQRRDLYPPPATPSPWRRSGHNDAAISAAVGSRKPLFGDQGSAAAVRVEEHQLASPGLYCKRERRRGGGT
jgi:hypothetical protein